MQEGAPATRSLRAPESAEKFRVCLVAIPAVRALLIQVHTKLHVKALLAVAVVLHYNDPGTYMSGNVSA